MRKAVVLLSGGLDSTTALYWAKKAGYSCETLSVFYGQRHRREIISAEKIAARAAARHHEMSLELPWLSSNSLVSSKTALPDLPISKIGRGPIPSTYVPGRNTVFLSLALSLADSLKASSIVIGANALDYSGYPDCRPGYLSAFSRAASLGSRLGAEGGRIRILAPLLKLDKKSIVRLALRLKAPLKLTWSCYAGKRKPCGRCDSCKLRAKGFSEAGVSDPAL